MSHSSRHSAISCSGHLAPEAIRLKLRHLLMPFNKIGWRALSRTSPPHFVLPLSTRWRGGWGVRLTYFPELRRYLENGIILSTLHNKHAARRAA